MAAPPSRMCSQCHEVKSQAEFRADPLRCATCRRMDRRSSDPGAISDSSSTRRCTMCQTVRPVWSDFTFNPNMCNACEHHYSKGPALRPPSPAIVVSRDKSETGFGDRHANPQRQRSGSESGSYSPKPPDRPNRSPSTPRPGSSPTKPALKSSLTPRRSHSTPRRHVFIGDPGDTMKQVWEFNAEDSPTFVAISPNISPTHAAGPPPAKFQGIPMPSAPHLSGTQLWDVHNASLLKEVVAQLMPHFDVSKDAKSSCNNAVQFLNMVGRAWPYEYAVCFSQSTRSYWLMARGSLPPDPQAALRAHHSIEATF